MTTNWLQEKESDPVTAQLLLTVEAIKTTNIFSYPAPNPVNMKLLLVLESSY